MQNRKITVFCPPGNIQRKEAESRRDIKIFLAGTIDMGNSEDWQKQIINKLSAPKKEVSGTFKLIEGMTPLPSTERPITIFNPRRPDWDNNVKQEFSDPTFYQQVNWELDALEKADIIIMNILPKSKSPITLLELGLYAQSRKLYVVCPEGFERKGNVDITCNRYNVPLFDSVDELLSALDLN